MRQNIIKTHSGASGEQVRLEKPIMWVLMGKHELGAQGTEINKHPPPAPNPPPNTPQKETTATEARSEGWGGGNGDTMLASIKKTK